MSAILSTYARFPIRFVRGAGSFLYDDQGKKYLDFLSGLAVTNLGHVHPEITKTICQQSKTLIHTSNLFEIPAQEKLARRLTHLAQLDGAFFCNSGAEAIEAGIKFARRWAWQEKSLKNSEIIVFTQAFHGRTWAALSATANPEYKKNIGPMVSGFRRVPFNDSLALKKAISKKTCAILLEVLQGEGGVNLATSEFIQSIKDEAKKHQLLIMIDEVQSGMGRTGRFFAFEHFSLQPDIVTLAKGLANGLPAGACLVSKQLVGLAHPGFHASTFGGSPFVATVADKVVSLIQQKSFLKKVSAQGVYLRGVLEDFKKTTPRIKAIRGLGLLCAIELNETGANKIVREALNQGLILGGIQDRIIRLAPPLNIARRDLDRGLKLLKTLIS